MAVRIIDANGTPSRTMELFPEYYPNQPTSVRLGSDVLVPHVRHPFTLDVSFIALTGSHPWTVQWDLAHDGQTFRPTVSDTISTPAEAGYSKSLGRVSRVHTYSSEGVHRVAMQVVDRRGHASAVKTWGATVVCGPPLLLDVAVEGSGRVEPVTAGLIARAEPGCEPILRYHWDFDGDGSFDEVTTEPSARHVYTDNPTGGASQRGSVRVESAGGHYDRAFEVPIENAAPRVEPIPEQSVTSTGEMTYQVRASDPAGAGDALTFSLAQAPDWVRVSETGLLSWSAPKAWVDIEGKRVRFDVIVRDDEGAEARVSVELVDALKAEPLPLPPPRPQEPSGCSTTGGGLPAGLVLLAFVLRARRRLRHAP